MGKNFKKKQNNLKNNQIDAVGVENILNKAKKHRL